MPLNPTPGLSHPGTCNPANYHGAFTPGRLARMWIMLCFGRLEKWAVRACPPSVTLPSPLHTLPASLVMSVGCWKSVPRLGTRKPRGHARTRALGVFPGVTSGEEPACQHRRLRDMGSISGSGRSHGGGNDSPLQFSCLENPTDRGAWGTTVHGVTKSQT